MAWPSSSRSTAAVRILEEAGEDVDDERRDGNASRRASMARSHGGGVILGGTGESSAASRPDGGRRSSGGGAGPMRGQGPMRRGRSADGGRGGGVIDREVGDGVHTEVEGVRGIM